MSFDTTLDIDGAVGRQHIRGSVYRATIPGLGKVAWCRDPGEALTPGSMMFGTQLHGQKIDRHGRIVEGRNFGSGVVTVTFVNALMTDVINGSSVVPILARMKFMDTGIGSTAATDGDTALQTPIINGPARAIAAIGNLQTATTGNHRGILSYIAAVTYIAGPTFPVPVTEWGLFDASSGGNMMDHRIFAPWNILLGEGILWTYTFGVPSNA